MRRKGGWSQCREVPVAFGQGAVLREACARAEAAARAASSFRHQALRDERHGDVGGRLDAVPGPASTRPASGRASRA